MFHAKASHLGKQLGPDQLNGEGQVRWLQEFFHSLPLRGDPPRHFLGCPPACSSPDGKGCGMHTQQAQQVLGCTIVTKHAGGPATGTRVAAHCSRKLELWGKEFQVTHNRPNNPHSNFSALGQDFKALCKQAPAGLMNKQIVEAYKTCGIPASQRLKRLNLSDVCAGGDEYPILKHCKGRRIRHFSKVTVKL